MKVLFLAALFLFLPTSLFGKSCEAEYWDLFKTKGAPFLGDGENLPSNEWKTAFNNNFTRKGPDPDTRELDKEKIAAKSQEIQKLLEEVRDIYSNKIFANPSLMKEESTALWDSLIHLAELEFSNRSEEREGAFASLGFNQGYLTWGYHFMAGMESMAAHAFVMGHELKHLNYKKFPRKLGDCLKQQDSYGAIENRLAGEDKLLEADSFSYALTFNKSLESVHAKAGLKVGLICSAIERNDPEWKKILERDGVVSDQGSGTEIYRKLKPCLQKANKEQIAELRKLIEPYKTALAEQMEEAVADYYGTLVVKEYIKKHYQTLEQQQQAARAVLYFFYPEFSSPEAREIMGWVGVKKPNETRATRIVLADPDFRELLGCKFEKATPKFCE